MKTIDKFLSENEYTHPPGRKLKEKRAVILHWVGVPRQGALAVWKYFEYGCAGKTYASAHYCIDLDGAIYRLIPDDDVAYHCGSSQVDPKSKRIYTDWAREIFGKYAEDPKNNSPNNAAIGIEMCVLDDEGNFSPETLQSAAELTAYLCKTYRIPIERVGTHNMVVGWKDCPRLWTKHPDKFEDFKKEVSALLNR
ncbi:MAG: peptidoglycan recognition protein family protein [Treponema sp.]|jgi:N-acetylmuramoyl-L-alanine amidase|nr:peptidoglycan recognition protein family protein [Treponema sp.]